ncbi:MAG: phosphoribosyltransferase [Actinomycetia bacterium]|nr:phosphoribosyltransferase [Actinomycetes bacterium]
MGEPGPVSEREILTWDKYGTGIRELAVQIADDGYQPDIILAIARGGLFAAGSLGYALSVKNLFVMNIEFYTGVDERLDVPVMLPPYIDLVDVSDKKFLIADDVADTGLTLKAVHEFCQGKVGEVRSAVLYEKPHSEIQCEYVWKRTDQWINFPWSSEDPVASPKGSHQAADA